MKQHITYEQLYELSHEQINKLTKMLGYSKENQIIDNKIPKEVTIGKMIEILRKKNRSLSFTLDNDTTVFPDDKERHVYGELTDALWASVKLVLKEKKTIIKYYPF